MKSSYSTPSISVVMPAFNRQKYIGEAIESILGQTFSDFELIIINDGSEDKTIEVVQSYHDPRIILITHDKQKGVAAARNTGYSAARGKYIAISDSDDKNLPHRLEKQYQFLEANKHIDVVACWIQEYAEEKILNEIRYDEDDESIRAKMIFNPGVPAFMMFRKEKIENSRCLFHDEAYKAAVDYQWYSSLPNDIRISCVPEVLYLYRRHNNQISTGGLSTQQFFANKVRRMNLMRVGLNPSEEEMLIHFYLCNTPLAPVHKINFEHVFTWCKSILEANKKTRRFNHHQLNRHVTQRIFSLLEQLDVYNEQLFNDFLGTGVFLTETLPENQLDIDLLAKKLDRNRCTIIYGTKRFGFYIKKELEKRNINLDYFLDHHIKINNMELAGKPVKTLEELKDDLPSCNIIISDKSFARYELRSTLMKEFNVNENHVFTSDDFM